LDRTGLNNVEKMPDPVFFLEISQLGDTKVTRSEILRRDLSEFLGLGEELPPILHIWPGKEKKKKLNFKRIDLCDSEHDPVRIDLMRISRNASLWFRHYFLKSEEVHLSSRMYLEEIFEEKWMVDPCIEQRLR
jgi:hypothetical protein